AVLDGSLLEPGAHIINIGGSGVPDQKSMDRVDVYLRFGDAPPAGGKAGLVFGGEFIGWGGRPQQRKYADGREGDKRAYGISLPEKRVTLAQLMSGAAKGRTSSDQITWSQRGNLQGAQFYAVGGKVYELAKKAGLGYEIPTSLFLQDIRD